MMNAPDDPSARQIEIIDRLRNHLARTRHGDRHRHVPVTTLTYAQSIDGSIAPWGGGTLRLSNARSQQLTHQIRALHDAIFVGINTVICDDPRLTVRLAKGKHPQPIVVDSHLRFPLESRLLRDPCVRPIIATGEGASHAKADQLTAAGARVVRVPQQEDGMIDLSQLMPMLKKMGFHSVMVEGGARVITSILASGLADQLVVTIAPRFVGGLHAVNPTKSWEHMPELRDVHYHLIEGDLVIWGQLECRKGSNLAASSPSNTSDRLP